MLRYSYMKSYSKEAWKEGYTPESWSEHQSFVFWSKVISVIAVLIVLLVLFPIHVSFAQERHHSHSAPTTAPVLVPSAPAGGSASSGTGGPSGFCMNALHDNPITPSAIMIE